MSAVQSSVCTNCNQALNEGRSVLYDERGDQHFCGSWCFEAWYEDNVTRLMREYSVLNISRVDL